MYTRVSSTQMADSSLYGIQQSYARFSNAETVLNTGKQLQKASDNPTGAAQVLDYQERSAELTQYNSNIETAQNFLSTTESALKNVQSLTNQARTIGVQAANGTANADSLSALSGQLRDITNQIARIGNTTYGSQYIFAGQRTDTAPIVAGPSGFTYTGGTIATGDASLTLTIGRSESVQINTTGDKVFVPLLNTLTKLNNDISSGSLSVVSSDLALVDVQLNNVQSVQADIGSKSNLLTLTQQRNTINQDNYTKFISNIQDADAPHAVVELQSAQNAYQAALSATSHVYQNSLLNFLK